MEANAMQATTDSEISGKPRLTRRAKLNQIEKETQGNLEDASAADTVDGNSAKEDCNLNIEDPKKSSATSVINSSTPRSGYMFYLVTN